MCPQNAQDDLDHSVDIGKDIVVPKPDHLPAVPFQPGRSTGIGSAVRMLAAIDFDHQAMSGTGEIGNEAANRMLPPKLVLRRAPIA